MVTRYRWFRIQLPRNNLDLNEIAFRNPFTQDSSFGFSNIEDEVDVSKLRFLWRTKITVTKLDSEGAPSYEQIASVSFTDIAIVTVNGVTFLRVENPVRNSRDLLNALESILGIGFTCKPLTFENVRPTTLFKKVEVSKLVGLKIIGAVVNEDLIARMEFVSKRGMIVENMKLLDGMHYKIDSEVFELIYGGLRGQVSFSSNGLVKVSGHLSPKLVSLIERDLPKIR
jgi:hypothetical protein